jgi:hypothetical protein
MTKTLAFFLTAALSTACAGQAEVHYSGDGARPELVAMDDNPEVSVVANADEPIFFADSTFWLYRGNTWWRSSSHRTGWSRADAPPQKVTRIAQPTRYVHYRHGEASPRTGFNERAAPEQLETPMPPSHDPNAEGPVPPRANPLPPNQVPPTMNPN